MNQKIEDTVIDGKYHVLSLLGQGGGGAVYKAYQDDLTRFVAIKIMRAVDLIDSANRLRFEREVAVLSKLVHENIIRIYAVGILNEKIPYLALEYIEGKTIASVLLEEKCIDVTRLLRIGMQLCRAVDFAHNQGIIHRDLKPANIMLLDGPDGDLVKVLDFGLSKLVHQDEEVQEVQKLTRTGSLIGSVHYMSPEMCNAMQVDFRSDIYSLGCVFYECLFGAPPFQADNPVGVLYKHRKEWPPSMLNRSNLTGFELVILKCLQKTAANRFQTASELCLALERLLDGSGEAIQKEEVLKLGIGSNSYNKAKGVWFSLLAVSLLFGLFVFFIQYQHQQAVVLDKKDSAKSSGKSVETRLKSSLARAEKAFGAENVETQDRLDELANYYMEQKRFAEAAPLYERSLSIEERVQGAKNSGMFWYLFRLAECYVQQRRFVEAEPLYKRALEIRTAAYRAEDFHAIMCLRHLADCYVKQNRLKEAELLNKRAVELDKKRLEQI